MSLEAGTKLGPYEIVSPLGAGGMGEVYRARDMRLDRTVAIKVLPQHLADTPEARQRFEREARAISSLNHPKICTLFDVGSQDGTDYLVMEYLEGETLADRVVRGPMPLDQVLKIGAEIAEALDKAHRAGITHRDLKPGNVMLTKSGVKLMDFGLARTAAGGMAGVAGTAALLSAAMTLTSPSPLQSPMTAAGTIIGTIQYMSPEQIQSKEADTRSDIFALGAVLYEMATGRRAFEGKSQLSVASAILEKEPEPVSKLIPASPAALDQVIRTCLAKDPDERFQNAHDLMLQLRWIGEAVLSPRATSPQKSIQPAWQRTAAVAIAAALAVVAGIAIWNPWHASPQAPTVVHFKIPAATGEEYVMSVGGLAISPDGAYVAFSMEGAKNHDHRQLYLRRMDRDEAVPVQGSEDAHGPFFSPDSHWVGFIANNKLKKVPVTGGTPITICDNTINSSAAWGSDDTIYFVTGLESLYRVPADGSTPPKEIAKVPHEAGEQNMRWPHVLPGGNAILYVTGGADPVGLGPGGVGSDDARICVIELKTGQQRTLIQGGTYPRYVSSGHLIYAQGGRLLAVPFDLAKLEVKGSSEPVLEDVWQGGGGYSAYDVSLNGSLVSVNGGERSRAPLMNLYWVDRKGAARPVDVSAKAFFDLRISPDGKQVALVIRDANALKGPNPDAEVYVLDLARGALTRITFSKPGETATRPIWTSDGKRLIYSSGDRTKLSWRAADGSGAEELLYSNDEQVRPEALLADGRLLFERGTFTTASDLWVLNLSGDHKAAPFLVDKFQKITARVSPDGRWLAYCQRVTADASEIYVMSLPGLDGKWQVATEDRISSPLWSRDGRQLFYRTTDGVMAVDVDTRTTFSFGIPHLVFDGPYHTSGMGIDYDIAPDGQHFLMTKTDDANSAPNLEIRVVLNWTEELKNRLGAAKK
jgi:eukaryotic-like serine/threonine-protein kinase